MNSTDPHLSGEVQSDYTIPIRRIRRSWRLIAIVMVGLLIVLAALLLAPAYHPPRESNRARCASNMRQIGLSMMMYANEHDHRFPHSLEEILVTEVITSELMVCPNSNDVEATGPTTRAVLSNFEMPGHCSYIYLGKGLTDQCDPRTVVLYEPLSNHGDGMNVLFGDGHAEYFRSAQAQSILKAAASHQKMLMK